MGAMEFAIMIMSLDQELALEGFPLLALVAPQLVDCVKPLVHRQLKLIPPFMLIPKMSSQALRLTPTSRMGSPFQPASLSA